MKKRKIPEAVMEHIRKLGAEGGKARAARHTKAELSAWGKLGGRPKGSSKKAAKRKGANP